MELIGNFTFILQDNSTYSAGWLDDSANRIASVIELLVFKMSLADAIDAPRFFVDEREDITLEGRFSADVIANLSDKGYQPKCLGDYSWMLGCMQRLACDETTTFVGDPRRHAVAMAY